MEILQELSYETERLLDAGARLAKADYRIEKLLPEIKKHALKAPVFTRISESLEKAISEASDPLVAADSLLEARNVIIAVLNVQAEPKKKSQDLVSIPIHGIKMANRKILSYREFDAIKTALTESGQGRMSILESAAKDGSLEDFRLVPYLIKGLSDQYEGVSNIAKDALVFFGKEIIPLIKNDLKGSSKDYMRLSLLIQQNEISFEELCDICLSADYSQRARENAAHALWTYPNSAPFLVSLISGKNKGLAEASADALVLLEGDDVCRALTEHLDREPNTMELKKGLRLTRSNSVREWLYNRCIDSFTPFLNAESLSALDKKQKEKALNNIIFSLSSLTIDKSTPMRKAGIQYKEKIISYFVSILDTLDQNGSIYNKNEADVLVRACLMSLYYDDFVSDIKGYLAWKKAYDSRYLPYTFQMEYVRLTESEIYAKYSPYLFEKKESLQKTALVELFKSFLVENSWDKKIIDRHPSSWDRRWKECFIKTSFYSLASGFAFDKDDKSLIKVMEQGDLKDEEVYLAFEKLIGDLCKIDAKNIVVRIAEFLALAKEKGKPALRRVQYNASWALSLLPEKRMNDLLKTIINTGDSDISDILRMGQHQLESKIKEAK